MIKKRKVKLIIIALMVVSVISSMYLLYNRFKVENSIKKVDFVLDYSEISKMSRYNLDKTKEWLELFKKDGVSTVALEYETIDSLEDKRAVSSIVLGRLTKNFNWENGLPLELVEYIDKDNYDENDLLVKIYDQKYSNHIITGLKKKYGENIKVFGKEYLVINSSINNTLYLEGKDVKNKNEKNETKEKNEIYSSKIKALPIYINKEKIDLITDSNMQVLIRVPYVLKELENKKLVESIYKEIGSVENSSRYTMFSGKKILGYDKYTNVIENFLKNNEKILTIVESPEQRGYSEQKGMDFLLNKTNFKAIRMLSISSFTQEKYGTLGYSGSEEIENEIYRGITERNIKLIYFRPFKYDSETFVKNKDEYTRLFKSLTERLEKHGIEIASIKDANNLNNKPNKILILLISISTIIPSLYIVRRLFKKGILQENMSKIAIFIVFMFSIFGLKNKVFSALLISLTYGTLGGIYFLDNTKKYYNSKNKDIGNIIVKGIKTLLIASTISLFGGLLLASVMSDTKNMLDIEYAVGVKLVQLLPILVFIIGYLSYYGYKRDKDNVGLEYIDIKNILMDNVKIIYVLAAVIVLGIGYVYIARTGHETNIKPLNIELVLRNTLENKFLARPRTKEFLIAFPAVLLGIFMSFNKQKIGIFLFGLLVVLGQTSIINTFSHFRTPLYISIFRTKNSILVGIALGIIYTLIFYCIIKLYDKIKKGKSEKWKD